MQLLVFILNDVDNVGTILKEFVNNDIPGTTVLDCHGSLETMAHSNVEPPSLFGSFRTFLSSGYEMGKMLITVLPHEKMEKAKQVIRDVVGDLSKPNTGIMFTISLDSVEGLAKH